MLTRKVLLVALLAVVLLASFMEGRVGVDQAYKHKRRSATVAASLTNLMNQVAGGIAAIDPNNQKASLTNLVNQVAGGIAGVDPTDQRASLTDGKKRRRPRAAIDPAGLIQVAGGIAALDPSNG